MQVTASADGLLKLDLNGRIVVILAGGKSEEFSIAPNVDILAINYMPNLVFLKRELSIAREQNSALNLEIVRLAAGAPGPTGVFKRQDDQGASFSSVLRRVDRLEAKVKVLEAKLEL